MIQTEIINITFYDLEFVDDLRKLTDYCVPLRHYTSAGKNLKNFVIFYFYIKSWY